MFTYSAGNGGTEFKNVSEGTHLAVCYMVADLGLQPGSAAFPTPRTKILVGWEVPGEMTDDGKRLSINRILTASMAPKASLRGMIESWNGKRFSCDYAAAAFDHSLLMGAACLLGVAHQAKGDKTYANVLSVTSLPREMKAPALSREGVLFAPGREEQLDQLPKWAAKMFETRLRSAGAFEAPDAPF